MTMREFLIDTAALGGAGGIVVTVGLYAPMMVPAAVGLIFLAAAAAAHYNGGKR